MTEDRLTPIVMSDDIANQEQQYMKRLLDRDQRTVLIGRRHRISSTSISRSTQSYDWQSSHSGVQNNAVLQTGRRNRLRDVLTISACLLTIIRWPSAMTSPTRRSLHENKPLWVNPCGGNESPTPNQDYEIDYGIESNGDLIINGIILQAKLALQHAELFKDKYVLNTFRKEFDDHHNEWKGQHYQWLPGPEDIPKHLGEDVPDEHLKQLELNKALVNTYEYMQKIAVGMEQVAWDQRNNDGEFMKDFKDVEYKLRAVLCEIQTAMIVRQLTQRPDVGREIMMEEFRAMSETDRKLRDWLIFRDYMNLLQYIKLIFEHFKKNTAPS